MCARKVRINSGDVSGITRIERGFPRTNGRQP